MPEPDTTPAACGFRHDEWDGPYRMPRRCTAPAGHSDGQFAYDHGPWECLPLGWVDPPADGTTNGTTGRTETGATIAESQVGGGGAGGSGADGKQPAYDAVYAYIRSLGDHLPPDPVHRNAIIWRGVNAVLAVRDQEMEALRAEIQQQIDAKMGVAGEWGNALADKATAEATTARVQAELDRIASLPTVTVDDGHADRFSVGARWTLNLIRAALTPPAPGGQTEGAQP